MMQMEKLLNHCDMELMKMAMLKHEETFRQQVHELHRLYRVQKQLMSGGPRGRRLRRRHPRRVLDLQLPADEYIGGGGASHGTQPSCREDELELTLAVGGRRKRRDDLASSCCGSGSGSARSPSSSSSNGSPYQTAVAFRLHEGQQQAPYMARAVPPP